MPRLIYILILTCGHKVTANTRPEVGQSAWCIMCEHEKPVVAATPLPIVTRHKWGTKGKGK